MGIKQKSKLFVILGVALLTLVAVPASAQQGVGTTPYAAHLLTSGLNVGSLAPGESFWYSFSQNDLGNAPIQSIILNLVFKPGDSRTARQVTFDVYNFDQVKTFLESGQPQGAKEGTGQLVDTDYDPNTAARLWAGAVKSGEVYYVHVQNASDLTLDYRLTAVPQRNAVPTAASGTIAVGDTAVRVRTKAAADLDPTRPDSKWMLTAQALQGMSTEGEAAWLKNAAAMGWFGGTAPLAAAQPEAVAAPKPEPTATPAPAVAALPVDNSIYPNNPLILQPRNVNRLAPHAEHWYTFLKNDFDNVLFEQMALTLFVTPGNGNITNLVNFAIFTGDQYQVWQRGTPDDMKNMGVGQRVSRDNDPNTGERLWRGMIVDGDRYYIKVRNDSDVWIDYYLLQGDIINTELGDAPNTVSAAPVSVPMPEKLSQPESVPPGTDIANPLTAHLGANRGRLTAGEDVWLAFRFQNFARKEPEQRHYTMLLKESPGLGYVANYVNLEIYTYPQLDLWLRGDGNLMTPMGVGSRQEYNPDTNTQLFAWDGYFVSDTTYFLRIRNDSEVSLFYDLDIQRR